MAARIQANVRSWRRAGATAILIVVVTTACADSRDASPEETIPRITSDTTSTLAPPTTNGQPASTAPPATTAAPLPLPTQATPPPTQAPTQPPTLPPAPAPTSPPTAPPTQAQTAPPTTRAAGPTSTLVVTPGQSAVCSAEGIGADTGHLVIEGVACQAGWAVGLIDGCPLGVECEVVDVFHVTADGWVHDGRFPATCAEALAQSGMSIYTAVGLNAPPCQGEPGPTEIIRPDSTGDRVAQLQTALVALGYDLAVDGRYGPRTQAAVRDVQRRNSLEVDGVTGPRTQAALGIGPGGSPAPVPTTVAPSVGPSSTVVVKAGEPVECTAAAISADIGRPVATVTACRGGWAIGPEACAGGDCTRVDLFHITDEGWVHDGVFPDDCVDDLTVTGMSVQTAAQFAELCADDLPERQNVLPGTSGPEVEQVQIALVALGYPIAVDGTYGPRTEAAVRDFQAANDLEVDGIAGPNTQTALGL